MRLRRLRESGLTIFEQYIYDTRAGFHQNTPFYLLDSTDHSEGLDFEIEIEGLNFESRFAMGQYLQKLLSQIELQKYFGDSGFWSWFALLWFEQLCPSNSDGSKKPAMPYNYILSKKYNHRPRHAILNSWQLVHLYGEDARFLLCNAPHSRGELAEQLLARQGILTCKGVMELASKLYLDTKTGKFKRGSAARKSAGCIARFVSWLQQIELTYDLYSSDKTELENILPKEFERFLGNKS